MILLHQNKKRRRSGSTQESMYSVTGTNTVKTHPNKQTTINAITMYTNQIMSTPVAGVLKVRKGELDSNWCDCWIVNARCLETRVEIEGSGSDDSWIIRSLGLVNVM
jgi:hypothetical protein